MGPRDWDRFNELDWVLPRSAKDMFIICLMGFGTLVDYIEHCYSLLFQGLSTGKEMQELFRISGDQWMQHEICFFFIDKKTIY